MKLSLFTELQAARAQGRAVALVTDLTSGLQLLVDEDEVLGELKPSPETLAAIRQALREDRSGKLEDGKTFVHIHAPPHRMIVVGAVHIAQALIPMAEIAGYAVTLVDPRQAWASPERFPSVELLDEWPDEALRRLKPDSHSAVVTLTHDPKLDDPALTVALGSKAFYIGALGSRRTHEKRLGRLREQGLSEAALARIQSPIGLAIGAKSPAEIAVSILAEITQIRRKGGTAKKPAPASGSQPASVPA